MPLTDFNLATLQAQLDAWGFKPSHARTILRAFYQSQGRLDLNALEIGNALRDRVASEVPLRQSRVITRHASADGTVKLLVGFNSGGAVESVLMPSHRPTDSAGCLSSQIGCAMGCDFCASTRAGLERNLSAGEIVEQFLHLREAAAAVGRRLRTIVFMGMGEPLHNFENLVEAVRRISHDDLGALGARQITVSTVGIVPAMDRLAKEDLNVHLALSLHAPDDETRDEIVPLNRRYRVAEVMAAARRFLDRSGRIPNIEYCLLAGVNDSDDHAEQLAGLMEGFRAHVNLIPYNWIGAGISGAIYQKPSPDRVNAFLQILRDRGVVSHIRVTRGDDVAAACGQLRERTLALDVL